MLIILIFPISARAHGDVPHFSAEAGAVPGSLKYAFDRFGEWFDINFLTVSTKKKQDKRLRQAEERLAEFLEMSNLADKKEGNLRRAAGGYERSIAAAEDMAEKIIFLDGAEIEIAYDLEERTSTQEKAVFELFEGAVVYPIVAEELMAAASAQNERIFRFIAEKYQFTGSDIERNKTIIGREIAFVEGRARAIKDSAEISGYLSEAKKFQKFGLTVQAAELIKAAKDSLFRSVLSRAQ